MTVCVTVNLLMRQKLGTYKPAVKEMATTPAFAESVAFVTQKKVLSSRLRAERLWTLAAGSCELKGQLHQL